jgi:flavin reductase (DIM6/NTAB) family NADH-FMN oxidoreductase RutF
MEGQQLKKIEKAATTILAPVPVVMVSCEAPGFRKNIITLAWVGTICSDPPLVSISIRPERYSYAIIKESKEFVINIPSSAILWATDYCGVVSGKDVDKFSQTGLTTIPGKLVKAPLIVEAPINIECRVKQVIPLGTHDLFIAEVLLAHVNENYLNEKEQPDMEKMQAVVYGNHKYYQVAHSLGNHGYSLQQPKE